MNLFGLFAGGVPFRRSYRVWFCSGFHLCSPCLAGAQQGITTFQSSIFLSIQIGSLPFFFWGGGKEPYGRLRFNLQNNVFPTPGPILLAARWESASREALGACLGSRRRPSSPQRRLHPTSPTWTRRRIHASPLSPVGERPCQGEKCLLHVPFRSLQKRRSFQGKQVH